MLSQALEMKSNIETRRSQNQLGCIVWQYNEIWPTGGWGSIEYGTVGHTQGQVLGGRWKPLQYFYKRSIYADVMATCGAAGKCFVKNDRAGASFNGAVMLASFEFATGKSVPLHTETVKLGSGAGVTHFFDGGAAVAALNGSTHMLIAAVVDADANGAQVSRNEIALAPPAAMKLPAATVNATVADKVAADGSVAITLDASAAALYVTLTSQAQGRFSDNAIALTPGRTTVSFIPVQDIPADVSLLKKTLRVEHLKQMQ